MKQILINSQVCYFFVLGWRCCLCAISCIFLDIIELQKGWWYDPINRCSFINVDVTFYTSTPRFQILVQTMCRFELVGCTGLCETKPNGMKKKKNKKKGYQ